MGAYGCALQAASQKLNSRTINQLLETTEYTSRQIQCNGCENKCFVCRYTFPNGNTFFSGNKCERIFTNRGESEKPGQNIYTDKYALLFDRETPETNNRTIGIPRVLNMYENYPFWHALFTRCGIRVNYFVRLFYRFPIKMHGRSHRYASFLLERQSFLLTLCRPLTSRLCTNSFLRPNRTTLRLYLLLSLLPAKPV